MKELVVISGKGGTGKTSLTAAFAMLADRPVVADCDVDAPDLHLVLSPRVVQRHEFRCGHEAVIRQVDCNNCGICLIHCRFGAVRKNGATVGDATFTIDPLACEGCGVCVRFCPAEAIDFRERRSGEWMTSEARCGPMVYARLDAAAENSGKLVFIVRREARRLAEEKDYKLILVDGPPGIGCPVIASITGASLVLVIAEPTVSGAHDLRRVCSLARHFDVPTAVCVNKWDLNPEITEQIEAEARQVSAQVLGRVRYDRAVTVAQISKRTVVEMNTSAGRDVERVWNQLIKTL